MITEYATFFRHNEIAKAMDYFLKGWETFAHFLDDGWICITNNAPSRTNAIRDRAVTNVRVLRALESRRRSPLRCIPYSSPAS